jgi:signal transduction histidine kinase
MFSHLADKSVEVIPKSDRAEFWRDITATNVQRIRLLLVFGLISFCVLIYIVNIRNAFRLTDGNRQLVFLMHVLLLSINTVFMVLFGVRQNNKVEADTAYFNRLIQVFFVSYIVQTQIFGYVILIAKGHPIFFFLIITATTSALIITPRQIAVLLGFMLTAFWVLLLLFSPPTNDSTFVAEAYVASAAVTILLIFSSSVRFRGTVHEFIQRKVIEGDRNMVAALNKKLLEQQRILEEQSLEIETFNTTLQQQNQTLITLSKENTELMGIVAHDLKNPIGAVQSLAELIENQFVEGEVIIQNAGRIVQISKRMLGLVENLLEMNRLDSGGIEFRQVTVDIVPMVESTIWQYQAQASAKNITLHFASEAASSLVFADEQATIQVLDNILSNAVKYSPHGKNVFIRVKASTGAVRVEVQDEGQGISPEDMTKLFGKFARLSAQPTGGEHSTGRDSALSKKWSRQ